MKRFQGLKTPGAYRVNLVLVGTVLWIAGTPGVAFRVHPWLIEMAVYR